MFWLEDGISGAGHGVFATFEEALAAARRLEGYYLVIWEGAERVAQIGRGRDWFAEKYRLTALGLEV